MTLTYYWHICAISICLVLFTLSSELKLAQALDQLENLKFGVQPLVLDVQGNLEETRNSLNGLRVKQNPLLMLNQFQSNVTNLTLIINQMNESSQSDPRLSIELDKLEMQIRSKLVLLKYEALMDTVKQLVFPYAHLLLAHSNISLNNTSVELTNPKQIDDLVTNAIDQIESVKTKLKHERYLKFTHYAYFYSYTIDGINLNDPFYVWTNQQYRSEIGRLLAGETIVVKADVRHSPADMDAIKFNVIDIKLKSQNETIQQEIDDKLNYFGLEVTHLGRSYYRYGDKVYVMENEEQQMEYSFLNFKLKYGKEEPYVMNGVYRKIKSGDLMLSPYAMWQIRLTSDYGTFQDLTPFAGLVDLELAGHGTYIERGKEKRDLKVDQYYDHVDPNELNDGSISYKKNNLLFQTNKTSN